MGVCNVSTGTSASLVELIEVLSRCVPQKLEILQRPARDGNIPFSEANTHRFHSVLDLRNLKNSEIGLQLMLEAIIPA